MGYELHMTRASHWLDSEECPITLHEWIEFGRGSVALQEEGYLDLDSVGRQPLFTWRGADDVTVGFHWFEGRVTSSGAHVPGVDLVGLAGLAAELAAYLIGDDGEQYPGSSHP
ncbi:hypothetical protein [Streptomyces sp. NPDC048489]|uniref:hypothetical protein n=1 Tax=Streptomyces sp. NPDC048489 TaxID=3154504 RepID=UPI0034410413